MIQDVRYGRYVNPRVAGRTLIKPEALEQKVGPAGYLLWRKLLWCRNESGVTHATAQTLATGRIANRDWETLTKHQVKRATAKLLKVGLLRNLGWRRPSASRTSILRSRVVYGAFVIDADRGDLVSVPRTVTAELEKLGRGGKRAGAGRPKKAVFPTAPINQSGQHKTGPFLEIKAANIIPLGISNISREEHVEKDFFLKEKMPSRGAGSFLSLQVGVATHGARVSGEDSSRPREDDRLTSSLIPPFPDSGVVEPPRVPHPLALESDMRNRELALAMAQAYRTVMTWRTGKECYQFARGDISKSKHYERLIKVGRALIEHELRPVCWIAWSLDGWDRGEHGLTKTGKKKKAPLAWVLNEERIHKTGGWCRKEASDYLGGRLVPGPILRELWKKYMAMRADLVGSSAPVPEIINNHFPDKTYERLVAEAREESARKQDDFRMKLERGEFLW